MIPFDSHTGIVMLLSILTAITVPVYILVLKRLEPRKKNRKKRMHVKKEVPTPKTEVPTPKTGDLNSVNHPVEPTHATPSVDGSSDCIKYFGFLKTLPRNSAIPDGCLGCPKIIKCLAQPQQTET